MSFLCKQLRYWIIILLCFLGSDLILEPETPAFVKKGQTLELTCQSNESGGVFGFFTFDMEGSRILLVIGGGVFNSCLSQTNKTLFECHLEEIWTFKLTLLNPIHNQTIICSRSYNQTMWRISTSVFVQGNILQLIKNYCSKHFRFTLVIKFALFCAKLPTSFLSNTIRPQV